MAPDHGHEALNSIAQNGVLSASIQRNSEALILEYMKSPDSKLDGSLHPALDTNDPRIEFVPESHAWKQVELETFNMEALYRDIALEQESFERAMEDYRQAHKSKYGITIGPSSSVHAQDYIKEVLESISEAQQLYEDDAVKGFWGAIRKSFRKLGENESAFVAWLGLLPVESNYISVLCGGLKLIIGAAARLRKLNKEVVDAMCQIPQSISKCRRLLSINKSSQQLRDYSTALYVAILHAMGHMLQYYAQNQWKKTAAAFASQNRFESKLTAKIEAIKECGKAIDAEALLCSQELVSDTNQIVRRVEKVVKIEDEKLDQLRESAREIKAGNAEIQQGQQRTDTKIETLGGAMTDALTSIQKLFMDFTEFKERVNQVTIELQKQKSLSIIASTELMDSTAVEGSEYLSRNSTSSPLPKPSAASSKATIKQLLSRLQNEYTTKTFSQTDIQSNLSHVFDLSLQDQDRAIHAMQALSEHPFLHMSASSVLLINGQAPDIRTRRTPMGFLCAKLCEALRAAPKTILCVSFFCAEHPGQRHDSMAGPAGILNSAIAQLVRQYKQFDFTALKDRYVSSLDRGDAASLMKVLSKLLTQLPDEAVVFVLLDELMEYVDAEREHHTDAFVRALLKLVARREKKGRGCVLKLLLTAAVELRLPAVADLDAGQVINVPEGLERQGGFTALQWDLSVGQDVGNLRPVK